jgi:hypothetical protein
MKLFNVILTVGIAAAFVGAVAACSSSSDTTSTSTGGTAGKGGSAGTSTGGTAGTAKGGSAGTSTGGSAGTSTGGSAGTSTGGSAGTSTGGSAGTSTGGSAGSSYALPEACVHASVGLVVECNPVANTGCASGTDCDFGTNDSDESGFFCFDSDTVEEGGSCANVGGPWCKGQMHCNQDADASTGTCAYMCCSASDCVGNGKTCTAMDGDGTTLGTFGLCL